MKTTKKDFETFKSEFTRWQKELSLEDWRVRFRHEPLDHPMAAGVSTDLGNHLASVYLGFTIDHGIPELSRHEALELLLGEMDDLARCRYARAEEIDAARHAVIRRLENLLDRMEMKEQP